MYLFIPAVHIWVEVFAAYRCGNEPAIELAWTSLSYLDQNAFREVTGCFISLL